MPRNRSLPPHLERRPSGFFWRRRLPARFAQALPPRSGNGQDEKIPLTRFLCFSLRIHVPAEARILARRLTDMSQLVFAADAETTMAIPADTQMQMLETLARFEIDAFERARAIAPPRSPEIASVDLSREEAIQSALRRAIFLGDREIARQPLRHVASALGVAVDEGDPDWSALAYEATKVLLDVSQERGRRCQGVYGQATAAFTRALGQQMPTMQASNSAELAVAGFACPRPFDGTVIAHMKEAPTNDLLKGTVTMPTAQPPENAEPIDVIIPAGLDMPPGMTAAGWQQLRIGTRPPQFHFNRAHLSEKSRKAISQPRGITLREAINLFFEIRGLGYLGAFDKQQKVLVKEGASWARENESKHRLALGFWPEILGDGPVDEIDADAVRDALITLESLPANHGKSETDRANLGIREIIERADAQDAALEEDLRLARDAGATEEELDRMRLEHKVPRISVTTYVKHGRVMRAVGEMLMQMRLIDQDPFAICSWTNKEVASLKSREESGGRMAWDDRINQFLGSPIFREPLEDVGDPLFWAPLLGLLQGLRMEECLQLGPDDFGSDKDIPYLKVRNIEINGVKSSTSERTLPVHPRLIELGLLKLVEMRREAGHIRLFPLLKRGQQKGTFSANFSKAFQYYRRRNNIYWPGLDFHALRTTFHHLLLADGRSDAIRCRIMGHARTDEGDRSYGQNLGIDALNDRMKSIQFNTSGILSPFRDTGATAQSRAAELGLRVIGRGL